MTSNNGKVIPLALTFDDVLLRPARSAVLPTAANTATRVTRDIALNIPIIASAMDTVTESSMAIAMAQAGGLGVIHKNLSIEEQAAEVRRVKKYESGMVVDPVTISPDARLEEALALMEHHNISGIPVVAASNAPTNTTEIPRPPGMGPNNCAMVTNKSSAIRER